MESTQDAEHLLPGRACCHKSARNQRMHFTLRCQKRGLRCHVSGQASCETFTLTGAKTCGGTLGLGTSNPGNDSSTVAIAASGAQLRLNFAGTDTVARLVIGTSQKPAGQYGHSSTGASNGGLGVGAMDAWFAPGPGTLTVTTSPPLSGCAAWRAANAPMGTASDDADGDGVANAIEYVLGGTGGTNDRARLPVISRGEAMRSSVSSATRPPSMAPPPSRSKQVRICVTGAPVTPSRPTPRRTIPV